MTDFTTRLPRSLYRAEQVRQLDAIAIKEFSIPGFTLMKRAAASALEALLEAWPQTRSLLVYVGAGNNGGDGYVLAGLAKDQHLAVTVVVLHAKDSLSGDALTAKQFAEERGVAVCQFEQAESAVEELSGPLVVVDALLGTGLTRAVSGEFGRAIEQINKQTSPVISIDVPSGLNADTGNPMPCAVHADLTATFVAMKQGMLTGQARNYVGAVRFYGLDIPDQVYSYESAPTAPVRRIDIHSSSSLLAPRKEASHKGSNGHVLIIGGDHGYGGAVIMAAEAAARSGAGLTSVISRAEHRAALLARCPEVMVHTSEEATRDAEASSERLADLLARASVIAVGPGLGRSDWSRDLFQAALAAQRKRHIPLIIDADALHLLAERREIDATLKRDNWLLTPHPGEAAALLGISVAEVQENRFAALERLASIYGGCCLLKGSGSLIKSVRENSTTDSQFMLCSEGNPGMASGGMGDVLSGILAGLLAQGMPSDQAMACAVSIHGEAADLEAAERGPRGLLATDLLPWVRQLVNPR